MAFGHPSKTLSRWEREKRMAEGQASKKCNPLPLGEGGPSRLREERTGILLASSTLTPTLSQREREKKEWPSATQVKPSPDGRGKKEWPKASLKPLPPGEVSRRLGEGRKDRHFARLQRPHHVFTMFVTIRCKKSWYKWLCFQKFPSLYTGEEG